jgi:type IV pilus assembly protein PilE
MRMNKGFTLIELMVVVAIIALLASVALPSYNNYVRRGQLQEAFTFLSDYRVKMEQYYQDNKNYGDTAGTTCATSATAGSWNGFTPGAQYFTFACVTSNDGQNYKVTATGSSGLTTGYVYTINQDGDKATTKYANATSTAACWLSRSSSC